ncbi:hypothetical protein [Acidovorax sp. BLS4]|uniref:hypothetical protein n=1 Tax=Acidovorax sp. BLS4 TaxID=3273430 RepID=UPI0029431756|nr:hypothetical protein [Paracidovorax avenae]WOI43763.1 hypothetical protein R1Z03_14580 [Paracidovorax avenae]
MDASDTPSAHVCTKITFEINRDNLAGYTDEYLAQLWHISQANPAPFGDRAACEFAEHVARECVRRFVSGVPLALWNHQGRHVEKATRAIASAREDLKAFGGAL